MIGLRNRAARTTSTSSWRSRSGDRLYLRPRRGNPGEDEAVRRREAGRAPKRSPTCAASTTIRTSTRFRSPRPTTGTCAGHDLGDPGGQGCVLREAGLPQRGGRAERWWMRASSQATLPGRDATPAPTATSPRRPNTFSPALGKTLLAREHRPSRTRDDRQAWKLSAAETSRSTTSYRLRPAQDELLTRPNLHHDWHRVLEHRQRRVSRTTTFTWWTSAAS